MDMLRVFLLITLLAVACTGPGQHANRRPDQADTLVVFLKTHVNPLFQSGELERAAYVIDSLHPIVKKMDTRTLTSAWFRFKAELLILQERWDSARLYLDQALIVAQQPDTIQKEVLAARIQFAQLFNDQQIADSARHYGLLAYYLARQTDTAALPLICLRLYESSEMIGDRPAARRYLFEGFERTKRPQLKTVFANNIARYYSTIGQTDSAIIFFKTIENDTVSSNPQFDAIKFENLGILLTEKSRFEEGLHYQLRAAYLHRALGAIDGLSYFNLASTYRKMGNHQKSHAYLDSALLLARAADDLTLTKRIWNARSATLRAQGRYKLAMQAMDSTYNNFQAEVDSSVMLHTREMETRFAVKEKDMQIASLAIANELNVRKQQQQRFVLFGLALAVLLLIITVVMVRRRRKLQQKLREAYLQQKVLQSQMEPHFVANILSVLKGFIRSGDQDRSIAFLQQFGRVTEQNLQNAQAHLITVQAELNAIDQYLALQSMQLENGFSYYITRGPDLEEDQLCIPPMLVQPFVENALTHGISGLDYKGDIRISVDRRGPVLHCVVEDNGRGLLPHQQDPGGRVHAIAIAKERLALVRWQTGQRARVEVMDKKLKGGQGVRVTLDIPWQYQTDMPTSAPHRHNG